MEQPLCELNRHIIKVSGLDVLSAHQGFQIKTNGMIRKRWMVCFALALFFALTAGSNTVTVRLEGGFLKRHDSMLTLTHCWDQGFFIGAGYGFGQYWNTETGQWIENAFYPTGDLHIGYNFKY